MELGAPLIPAEAVEPVWFGLVDHVEDLAFEADGTVWCGGEEGQVYRGRLDGAPEIVARTPGRTYGFALGPDGACYCADVADPGIYRIDSEREVERVSAGTGDRPALLPNDLAFLPSGELLFSDSGNWGGDDGCIYAVGTDGSTRVVDATCAAYPNGLCVSPDGSEIAVVESTLPGVSVLSLGADGSLSDRRVLVELPGTVGRPHLRQRGPAAHLLLVAGRGPAIGGRRRAHDGRQRPAPRRPQPADQHRLRPGDEPPRRGEHRRPLPVCLRIRVKHAK
jgi:hypothetical protein